MCWNTGFSLAHLSASDEDAEVEQEAGAGKEKQRMNMLRANQGKRRWLFGVLGASAGVVMVVLVLTLIAWRAGGARPAPMQQGAGIQTIADIPLSGGTSRFDYQSLDQQRGLLFIAHLGASLVSVFDTRASRIVTDIPEIAGVHGVLVVPELGRVYASALRPGGSSHAARFLSRALIPRIGPS